MADERPHKTKTGPKEIGWFIGLWALGVAVVLTLGGLIRWAIM